LPTDVQATVQEAIEGLAVNPRPHQAIKLAGAKDIYRLRVGRYRIVYTIDDQRKQVVIYRTGHRRDVYR
jgi:mRNA interferase RelE/StbE